MSNRAIGIVLILILIIVGYVVVNKNASETKHVSTGGENAIHDNHSHDEDHEYEVEEYVIDNISELSPEPEVLGGTFYVTAIEVHDGIGTVEYEDGHNAFVADFAYEVDDTDKITITTFDVRSL